MVENPTPRATTFPQLVRSQQDQTFFFYLERLHFPKLKMVITVFPTFALGLLDLQREVFPFSLPCFSCPLLRYTQNFSSLRFIQLDFLRSSIAPTWKDRVMDPLVGPHPIRVAIVGIRSLYLNTNGRVATFDRNLFRIVLYSARALVFGLNPLHDGKLASSISRTID